MPSLSRNYRIIPFFIVALIMVACTETVQNQAKDVVPPEPTAKDIVVSELSDPCQCVDAMLMTVGELIASDLEGDTITVTRQNLLEIQHKIECHCIDSLKFSKQVCAACDNFQSLEDSFQFFNR